MVRASRPRLARSAMPGMTNALKARRTVFMASMSIAAGWRWRASELILLPRELGDPVAHRGGYGGRELGDPVASRGRVEDDRREAEPALQRSALGVDVLDAGERHERPADPDDPPLQVYLLVPDLVAPTPPPETRHRASEHSEERERREEGQDAEQRGKLRRPQRDPAGQGAGDQQRKRPESTRYPPERSRPRVQ